MGLCQVGVPEVAASVVRIEIVRFLIESEDTYLPWEASVWNQNVGIMRGIELREGEPELLIDNVSARYGQLSDRLYFMLEYAYCWHDYLMDLERANLGDRLRSIIRDGRTLQDVMRDVEREREGCTF